MTRKFEEIEKLQKALLLPTTSRRFLPLLELVFSFLFSCLFSLVFSLVVVTDDPDPDAADPASSVVDPPSEPTIPKNFFDVICKKVLRAMAN